ncbi:MAG: amino acid ABC transporter permease [Actinomycetes bacterium]
MTPVTPDVGSPYVDPVRRDLMHRKARRDVLVASASLVAFVVVAVVFVSTAPGWPTVQELFFSGESFSASIGEVLSAFWLNVRIFLIAEPAILVLALAIALVRGTSAPVMFPLRVIAAIYTDIFRGIPTILLVLLLGFGVPALNSDGITNEPLVWGTVALVLSYSAYVAEVFRAGIESVHPSQRSAARSLGLSASQTSRYVVLPQAIRRVVPPLLNDFISLQKDTALVSVIGPIEALRQAQIDSSFTFNFTPYVCAALLFIALTVPMTRFADWLNARAAKQRNAGGSA